MGCCGSVVVAMWILAVTLAVWGEILVVGCCGLVVVVGVVVFFFFFCLLVMGLMEREEVIEV